MNEFSHYSNHKPGTDTDNCSGCALTTPTLIDGKMGINYAGWPLSYLQNGRSIPKSFYPYLIDEIRRTDNLPYVKNLIAKLTYAGYESVIEEALHGIEASK